jgi:hypothetical protein
MNNSSNGRANFSLLAGIAVVTVIPVISFLVAPCGFPLALVLGISAIVVGRRSQKEAGQTDNALKLARRGVTCGWIGLALNTIIMLIKLAMFVVMIVLPAIAIFYGVQSN